MTKGITEMISSSFEKPCLHSNAMKHGSCKRLNPNATKIVKILVAQDQS